MVSVLIPLRFIYEESELKAFNEITKLLKEKQREVDSQCLSRVVLHLLVDVIKEDEYTNSKENLETVSNFIETMDKLYECENPSSLGIKISPNPGVIATNELGEEIIRIIKRKIRETIEELKRVMIAPMVIDNPKSRDGMTLALEYAFNAFPLAMELINGPTISVKLNLKGAKQ